MGFWMREIAGWLLVVLSLFVFYVCMSLLLNHYIIETLPMTIIGIFLFRGGIHLLKVAIAARICQQARERQSPDQGPITTKSKIARPTPGPLPRSKQQ